MAFTNQVYRAQWMMAEKHLEYTLLYPKIRNNLEFIIPAGNANRLCYT